MATTFRRYFHYLIYLMFLDLFVLLIVICYFVLLFMSSHAHLSTTRVSKHAYQLRTQNFIDSQLHKA